LGRLKDKVAIITGGAKGMGAATCRLFADEGAQVIICDVAQDDGEALARDLGERARFHRLDVTSEEDWRKLATATLAQWGRIDILVNNAGVLHFADIANLTEANFERVLDVNVKGTFLGVKTIGEAMKRARRGAIVNISSIDGLRGANGVAAYVASKWAVRGLTKCAALEYGPHGVRVNSVHPGGIDTEMGNPMRLTGPDRNLGYEVVPLQRIGEPSEVAAATLFLCSDESSYITGAELTVDGGWSSGHYHVGLPGAPSALATA
jgi:3alpha(or 20beta)-hydroxysteroid dehydrogenase